MKACHQQDSLEGCFCSMILRKLFFDQVSEPHIEPSESELGDDFDIHLKIHDSMISKDSEK
jgi:hypothetical protein